MPRFYAPSSSTLVIANGKIVDGAPRAVGISPHIAIKRDTIAAIGHFDAKSASRTIDAKGMVIAPGFIDIHTHARRGIFIDPSAQNYIRQGVTTLLEGNDGSSPLPIGKFLADVAGAHPAPNFGTFAGQGSIRQRGDAARQSSRDARGGFEKCTRPDAAGDAGRSLRHGDERLNGYAPGNFTPPG